MLAVLKADATAELLDCEVDTLNARALSGDLPGLKIGRSWVFPVAALEARLNEMAVEEAAARRAPKTPVLVAVRRRGPPSLG